MPCNQRDKYIGKTNYNSQGYLMKIISYNNYNDIEVEFAEPYHYITKTGTGHFLNGAVANPYSPTQFGVGIVGTKYPPRDIETKKYTKEFGIWYSMLRRCFSENFKNRFPTYREVICDPVWFKYEVFYEWVHEQSNYDTIKNLNYNIDKDILFKGNKVYAPNKCVLVPQNVNKLLTKDDAKRGKYPIGVIYDKYSGYYSVYCNDGKRQIHLNNHLTVENAFKEYKNFKEATIKRIATEEFNKGTITKICYEALMNYQVEITD